MLPDYSDREGLWRRLRYASGALVLVGAAAFVVQVTLATGARDPAVPVLGPVLFGVGVLSAGAVLVLFRRRIAERDPGRFRVDTEVGALVTGSLFAALGIAIAAIPLVYG